MNNNNQFPQFSFFPTKLKIEREIIEKKYEYNEDADKESMLRLAGKRIPALLKKIRKLSNRQDELKKFASSLKSTDVKILSYEYPYHEESSETLDKLTSVLIHGYISVVGRTMWQSFQHSYEDHYIHRILQHTFKVETPSFLGLSYTSRTQLNHVTKHENGLLSRMIEALVKTEGKTKDRLLEWKVKVDSPLFNYLYKERLIISVANNSYIQAEGLARIIEELKKLTNKDFKKSVSNYVASRSSDSFHHALIVYCIERLGNPRKDRRPWSFLPEADLAKIIQWLLQHELKNFFEQDTNNERFIYWRKYVRHLKDLDIVKDPSIISMDFGSFVVVEFGKIGAAYFYHSEGFYDVIFPRKKAGWFLTTRNSARKEAMFKEKDVYEYGGIPLYIHKINHYKGSWYQRFDRHMNEYLQGYFNFRD